jgi:hypothetical protein
MTEARSKAARANFESVDVDIKTSFARYLYLAPQCPYFLGIPMSPDVSKRFGEGVPGAIIRISGNG